MRFILGMEPSLPDFVRGAESREFCSRRTRGRGTALYTSL